MILSPLSVKTKSFLLDFLENPHSTYGNVKELCVVCTISACYEVQWYVMAMC